MTAAPAMSAEMPLAATVEPADDGLAIGGESAVMLRPTVALLPEPVELELSSVSSTVELPAAIAVAFAAAVLLRFGQLRSLTEYLQTMEEQTYWACAPAARAMRETSVVVCMIAIDGDGGCAGYVCPGVSLESGAVRIYIVMSTDGRVVDYARCQDDRRGQGGGQARVLACAAGKRAVRLFAEMSPVPGVLG